MDVVGPTIRFPEADWTKFVEASVQASACAALPRTC